MIIHIMESQTEESKCFSVNYNDDIYNIYDFLNNHHHPGGINYVKSYEDKDITKRMQKVQHSKAALYLLRQYKKGGRDTSTKDNQDDLEVRYSWSLIRAFDHFGHYRVWSIGSNPFWDKWWL